MDNQKNIYKKLLPIVLMLLATTTIFAQKVVRYDLYVKDTIVNFTGKEKRAIAVNGQIPMPTLTFTEGDTAEIHVHNRLRESTSLHWHGLFLPNKEDGVPNLTQMPIKPGTIHKYTFPIIQNGTHWYHSHSGLQEQIGMYGMFIMNKKEDDKNLESKLEINKLDKVKKTNKKKDDIEELRKYIIWKPVHMIEKTLEDTTQWTTTSYETQVKEHDIFVQKSKESQVYCRIRMKLLFNKITNNVKDAYLFIESKENVADIFTKAVEGTNYKKHGKKLLQQT